MQACLASISECRKRASCFVAAHAQTPRNVLFKGNRAATHANHSHALDDGPSSRRTLKTLVRCCLKSTEKGPQWLNGQKSAESPMKNALCRPVWRPYQNAEKGPRASGRRTLKALVRCCLKGFGAPHTQNPRRVLLKGLRGGARSKPS